MTVIWQKGHLTFTKDLTQNCERRNNHIFFSSLKLLILTGSKRSLLQNLNNFPSFTHSIDSSEHLQGLTFLRSNAEPLAPSVSHFQLQRWVFNFPLTFDFFLLLVARHCNSVFPLNLDPSLHGIQYSTKKKTGNARSSESFLSPTWGTSLVIKMFVPVDYTNLECSFWPERWWEYPSPNPDDSMNKKFIAKERPRTRKQEASSLQPISRLEQSPLQQPCTETISSSYLLCRYFPNIL